MKSEKQKELQFAIMKQEMQNMQNQLQQISVEHVTTTNPKLDHLQSLLHQLFKSSKQEPPPFFITALTNILENAVVSDMRARDYAALKHFYLYLAYYCHESCLDILGGARHLGEHESKANANRNSGWNLPCPTSRTLRLWLPAVEYNLVDPKFLKEKMKQCSKSYWGIHLDCIYVKIGAEIDTIQRRVVGFKQVYSYQEFLKASNTQSLPDCLGNEVMSFIISNTSNTMHDICLNRVLPIGLSKKDVPEFVINCLKEIVNKYQSPTCPFLYSTSDSDLSFVTKIRIL